MANVSCSTIAVQTEDDGSVEVEQDEIDVWLADGEALSGDGSAATDVDKVSSVEELDNEKPEN